MNFMKQYDDASLNKISRFFNQVEQQAYDLPRENLDGITSVPMKGGVNAGALTFTCKKISELGMAKIIADNAKDLPPISRAYKYETAQIKNVGASYSFTQQEIDSYLFAGGNIDTEDANTARRKIDECVDRIILLGDKENGLGGLLNNENVTVATAGSSATGSSKKWKDKTFQEVCNDIQSMLDAMWNANKGANGGTTLRGGITIKLPREAYVSIATRYRSSESDRTFLMAILDLFRPQGVIAIEECESCNEAGESGASRACAYVKSPENLFCLLPLPFRILPAQYVGLSVIYNCTARTGGTVWRRPTSGVYMDGI